MLSTIEQNIIAITKLERELVWPEIRELILQFDSCYKEIKAIEKGLIQKSKASIERPLFV